MSKSEGAPRKTTTYNTFGGMDTQNERYGVEKEFFFWLENIMWVGPHKLHSVPGPRAIASIPVPPVPPVTPSCPPEPTITHIDEGFTQIFLDTVYFDPVNMVAYYAGSASSQNALTAFDMVNASVLWQTFGNGVRWGAPATAPADGDLYAIDFTVPSSQKIIQVNTADGVLIRESLGSTVIKAGSLKMTDTAIYNYFSSASLNLVSAWNVAALTLNWSTTTPGTAQTGNRISGGCLDGSGDFWVHVHTNTVGLFQNALIHYDPVTGAKTAYDISSAHPAGTFMRIAYDSVNNTIVVSGNDGITSVFDLGSHTSTVIFTGGALLPDVGSGTNGIVDGKIWRNTNTAVEEYDALTGALLQTILKTTIVGGVTVTSWANLFMMSALNCVHLNHGSFPAHPIGGVDKLCLPC